MVSVKSDISIPSEEEIKEYNKKELKIKQKTKFKDATVDVDQILEKKDGKVHEDF